MISLTVMGILLMQVVGLAQSYVANARLRTIADEFRVGLMTAKMEAIKRNTKVTFSPCISCANWSTGWRLYIPASYTDGGTTDLALTKKESITSVSIVAATTASTPVTVTTLSFTGSGRPTPTNDINFDITPSVANDDITSLRVVLSSGGQIKVCNPKGVGVLGC